MSNPCTRGQAGSTATRVTEMRRTCSRWRSRGGSGRCDEGVLEVAQERLEYDSTRADEVSPHGRAIEFARWISTRGGRTQ